MGAIPEKEAQVRTESLLRSLLTRARTDRIPEAEIQM
jgi:hypothetical protein